MAIQWRKLAELALGRATQTEQPSEKALLLDIAARYRDWRRRPTGSPRHAASQIKNKGDAPGAGIGSVPLLKPSPCGVRLGLPVQRLT